MKRAGIAGFGVVGKRRSDFIQKIPDLELTAVCDQTFKGAGFLENGVAYFGDYRELIKQKLDILFVCISNDMAAEVTIAGLKAGFHVFCEKPPARNLREIEEVIKCEKQNSNLKLKYGFNHRYHMSVKDALYIIESGNLGRVINLRGVYGKSQLVTFGKNHDWRTSRELAGGGILLDQGIHMVDLMRLFGGEYTEVNSVVSNAFWNHDVEDNAYALMKTEEGVVAMLHSSATQWRHSFNLEITLETGLLILSGILSGSKSYGNETLTIIKRLGDDRGDPVEELREYDVDPSWEEEIKEFCEVVLEDKKIINGNSLEAYKTMKLVYDIYCADELWKNEWMLDNAVVDF